MRDLLEMNPIIASIKNDEHIDDAIKSDCEVVFLLNGDIVSIGKSIKYLQKHNKKVFVHVDMIVGISSSPIIVDFIKNELHVDGILTTKSSIVKRALEIELPVVQRFFFIDSMSLENAISSLKKIRPQAVEIMPGIVPKVIKKINNIYPSIPIICGGLIDEKDEIINVLSFGATSVSATNNLLW